jgi:predicted  nucleic acid-binding Zn-ribbon protein
MDRDDEMGSKIEDLSFKIGELSKGIEGLQTSFSDLSNKNSETHRQILDKLDNFNSKVAVQENEVKHCVAKTEENKVNFEAHLKHHPAKETRIKTQTNINTVFNLLFLIYEAIKLRLGFPF